MAMNQQLWTRDFAANLYDEKDWYRLGLNWSSFINGGIVHIPQATSQPTPVEITSMTSYPVSVNKITYGDLTFNNKMIAAPPRFVTNIDASEASFDTRSEEMKQMVAYLRQAISIEVAQGWSVPGTATGSIIRTTGTTTRSNIYGNATMKALTFADILNARAILVRGNANLDNVYLVVDPIQYQDLVLMGSAFVTANELTVSSIVKGFVGEVAGIKVIQRNIGIPYLDSSGGPTQVSTLNYADSYSSAHLASAMLVDGDKAGFALGTMENGEIQVGFEPYATGYYNDVLQAHTRIGANYVYAEASNIVKGVVNIIETA